MIDVALNKYLRGASTDRFAPYLGGGILVDDEGEARNIGWGVQGYFGVEGLVIDHVSLGGRIGMVYKIQGSRTEVPVNGGTADLDGEKTFATATSALTATLYW
jgi:hypothetical protein